MSEEFKPDSHIAEEIAIGVPPPQDILTQEQIESRHHLVALHRETKEGAYSPGISFVEELSSLPADEARDRIRELRRIAQETGRIPHELQEYNAYVTDLREIRSEQREHIAQELEKIPEDASPQERREVFITALDHSPPLATRTLEKVNQIAATGSSFMASPRKIFRDDQITDISHDPEKFKQALTQMIINEPDMVFRASTIMEQVASPAEIRSALDALKVTDPDSLLGHLPYVMQHYSRDEARTLITTLAEKSPESAIYRIMSPEITELIGVGTVAGIANKALESSYPPYMGLLEDCVSKGFFTKEALKARILADIEPNPDAEKDNSFSSIIGPGLALVDELMRSDLYTAEEKAEVHDKVLGLFQTADDTFFRSLEYTSILTQEEKISLFQEKFASDPMGAVEKYASMVNAFLEPEVARETILRYVAESGPEAYNNTFSILSSSALTVEDKRNFVLEVQKNSPDNIFGLLSQIDGSWSDEIFSQDEISGILRNTLEVIDMATSSNYLDAIIKYIDVSELKLILVDKFTQDPSAKLFISRNKGVIDQIFTKEEQLSMLNQSVDHQLRAFSEGDNTLYEISFQSIQDIFGDEVVKSVADRVLAVSP